MTSIGPAERPAGGSHRRAPRSSRLLQLLISLLVVVLVAVGVFAALRWRHESSKPAAAKAPSATARPHPSASPTLSLVAPTTSAAGASTSAAAPPSAASASIAPTTPTVSPSASSAAPAVRLPVDVLNGTHISGLAAQAKSALTSAGWTVAETGNANESVSATTVFYPAGDLPSAQLLAGGFSTIKRVEPATSGLSTTHLTLVVTQDLS